MAQMASKAQLKENASLLEVLRQKYAEHGDTQSARSTENLLAETSGKLEKANNDARELIKSMLTCVPRETSSTSSSQTFVRKRGHMLALLA